MVFRQNTRPGLVFFGSRAAKLTFLFRFAEMDNLKNRQGCWRNKMELTRLQLSRDLKPEKMEALGRRETVLFSSVCNLDRSG